MAPFVGHAARAGRNGPMASSPRDRISVDLRGMKGALLEQAHARGVLPSAFVRSVLGDALALSEASNDRRGIAPPGSSRRRPCLACRLMRHKLRCWPRVGPHTMRSCAARLRRRDSS